MVRPRRSGRAARGRRGGGRFAAVAGQHGIHVIQYGRERQGMRIEAGVHQRLEDGEVGDLGAALADAIEALGGRGGSLDLGLTGFGTAHHILALPDAPDELLRPVVRRELTRYYRDLADPVIGHARGSEVAAPEGAKRELLVGGVPRRLGERLHADLAARSIRLRHLTVLPQSLQRLYEAFHERADPAVVLLVLETGPLIGCFYRGFIRLFIEPPADLHGRPILHGAPLAEQVDRAQLFLRQQFPGSGTARVLVAAPAGDLPAIRDELAERLGLEVERLAEAPAGSLAALGVALDAGSDSPLRLLPGSLRPRSATDRWTRRLAATSAAVLTGAAVWWAGSAMLVARAEAERASAAETAVAARMPWLRTAQEALTGRRAHAQRLGFLAETATSRVEAQRILAALAEATGPGIRLERATIGRHDDGWRIAVRGVANGRTGAAAVSTVNDLYRGLPARLPARQVDLGDLTHLPPTDGGAVAIGFDMSFIIQWDSELQR